MPDALAPPRPSRDTAQLPADGTGGDSSAEAAELHEHAPLLSDVCSSHLGHEDEGSESARLLAAGGSGTEMARAGAAADGFLCCVCRGRCV
jgi:hypothetical protein